MKNHTLIKAASVLIGISVVAATALIVTQVVLGYSGFKQINGRSSVVVLAEGCQEQYTKTRFGEALTVSLQISFILSMATELWSGLALLFVLCGVYCRAPSD